MEPSHDKATGLINIGLGYVGLRSSLPDSKRCSFRAGARDLSEAGTIADRIGDRRTASYAWGYLGKLYEEENRYPEALQLTRRAINAAQQVNAPESLYRWNGKPGDC